MSNGHSKPVREFLLICLAIGCAFSLALTKDVSAEAQTGTPSKSIRPKLETVIDRYEAVGTVRPRTETRIEAQITAQVKAVHVGPGTKVGKGQILLTLDDRQLRSRLDQAKQSLKSAVSRGEQARQAVVAAQAAYTQAESAFNRTKTYFRSQAATSHDLEQAESVFVQAGAGLKKAREAQADSQAGIDQAEEVVREAEIALGYSVIKAPESGEVLKKLVASGDLAAPGKPLLVLRTSGFLRLEAHVREGLIKTIHVGMVLPVYIQTLKTTLDAAVEEIVPYADPQTRTFLVKAGLPHLEGLYPGMYAKLLIPGAEHQVVTLPNNAVQRVGQLELVWVKTGNGWQRRFVKTGKRIGNRVEILSGLEANEIVGMEE